MEMNGQSDKATLHQSAIELRGSTVVSASRGVLVEVCPTAMHEKVGYSSLHLCYPPSVGLS